MGQYHSAIEQGSIYIKASAIEEPQFWRVSSQYEVIKRPVYDSERGGCLRGSANFFWLAFGRRFLPSIHPGERFLHKAWQARLVFGVNFDHGAHTSAQGRLVF